MWEILIPFLKNFGLAIFNLYFFVTWIGQFVKSHHMLPKLESVLVGPDNQRVNFNLDLIWSQYTYEYPEQTWKAVSNSILNVNKILISFITIKGVF